MTACPDQTLALHGLLDGELDAANTLAAEAHLKTCAGCHAEYQRLVAVREAVRAPDVAYRAPEALRARLEALIDAPAAAAPRAVPGRARRAAPWAVAGLMSALAASLAVVMVMPGEADPAREIDSQLVAGHVRSLLANHLTDVATSNQHVVRPWFNGRTAFAPPVPELAADGFPLAGGRLDYIDGRVVPAIVYRRRLHTVNLFVWPDAKRPATPDRTARRDGYSLVEWSQGGLRFSAVSDIDVGELEQFRQAFSRNSPR